MVTARTHSTRPVRIPILRGMPPRRRAPSKDTPAKLAKRMSRHWRVVLLRAKGQVLGDVEAPDAEAAKGRPQRSNSSWTTFSATGIMLQELG